MNDMKIYDATNPFFFLVFHVKEYPRIRTSTVNFPNNFDMLACVRSS